MTTKHLKLRVALAGLGLALAMTTQANAVTKYPGDDFIRPHTRIKGCIAIMDKVRDGTISPTEWMLQNKEDFADLQEELRERNYKPDTARLMFMGMAITICMSRKVPDYTNTCVSARDPEKRDVQMMKTAHVPECWNKPEQDHGNNGNGGGGDSTQPREPHIPPPVIVANPWGVLSASAPSMSREDRQQFDEDVSIASRPVQPTGGQDYNRFSECASYWQSLHYNRPPVVRSTLYSVRIARCMFANARGSSYVALLGQAGCPVTFGSLLQPGCYARF
jgi:hypothetical protein